jgi:hypothetical protein
LAIESSLETVDSRPRVLKRCARSLHRVMASPQDLA